MSDKREQELLKRISELEARVTALEGRQTIHNYYQGRPYYQAPQPTWTAHWKPVTC